MSEGKRIIYAASVISHINRFHRDYINALRRDGYEVFVMARGEGADFDIPFEKKILSGKNRECRRRIRQIVRELKPDAIILNTSLAAFHIRLALRGRRRPRIVNIVHGYLFSESTPLLKRIPYLIAELVLARRTDVIITMNSSDLKAAEKYRLARESVLFCRGMGAAVREIITPPRVIRAEYFGKGAFVLCFVGELSKRKNQRFLILAMPSLIKRIPDAVLCLVGDGSEREGLERLSRELSLGDRVLFVGERRDACDFMRASDLYVSSSLSEGLPFNIIEAMGVGRTVLASRVKGHVDIIDDGVDGFLYEMDNITDFVNKTCQIWQNNPLSGEDIQEKYLKYSKENVLPETIKIIKESIEIDFCRKNR